MDDVGGVKLVRVLYFSQDYSPHDHRFLEALSKTEHEVHFLRLENRGRSQEKRPLPDGISPIVWSGGTAPFRLRRGRALLTDLRRILKRLKPDVVHAGPVQRSAFLTALTGYQPLVTMSWGSDMLLEARRGLGRKLAAYTLRRTQVFVCDCQAVRRRAIELGMEADAIIVFPWGVDLDHFTPGSSPELRRELGWETQFVFLSTRAWEPLYRVDQIVQAFLRAAAVEPNLRLLLLGDGSMAPELRHLIASAGASDRIHIAGQVGYDELPRYYRAADVYVSASRSDGSSVSLMEALACGLPALVSDIPGNREWVEPGANGWWFAGGDAPDLEQKMLAAHAARERLAAFGQGARQVAEDRADWTRNFPRLMDAYDLARRSLELAQA